MNRTGLIVCLLVLAFLGIADAAYLAESAITDTALSCDIGAGLDGCNTVAQSPYSRFLGVPLGVYGMVYYAVVFVLAVAALTLPLRHLPKYLFIFTGIGALASVAFILLQLFVIQAICIYCFASAIISFLLFFFSYRLRKLPEPILAPVLH